MLTLLGGFSASGQTTTVSSGYWSDPSVWSTGVVPGGATNVTVNHPLIIDQNIVITTGDYIFNADVTDIPGGTNYTLTANTTGGLLDVAAGTTTFGGSALDNSLMFVRSGANLITGAVTINNNAEITIEAGGTWTVNGDFTNNNNGAGLFTVAGIVFINGNYNAPVGSVEVSGGGNIITTGTISTNGSSEVFGSTNNCSSAPCSGQNLCSFTNSITADQILCPSSTPAVLDGNAVGGSPTYLWESSTTSATSGFAAAAGTNNAEDYTPGALAQTTWFRRVATRSGCTGTTVPVKVTIHSAGGWLGTTSDWNTASNWCSNAVPDATTDVSISTGVSNQPQISAAASCKDLTIGAGASVTINSTNSLSIHGNLAITGTFTTNSSTVTFAGTAAQTISGTPPTFNNLTINNSSASGISLSTFVNVNGTLTMTQGLVDLTGHNFTLGSSAGSPGTLGYTAGHLFGSTLTRYFNTPTIAIGNTAGHFPVGTSTDYRPFFVGIGTTLTTGGTIRVGHTGVATTSDVAFADGGSTVLRRQDSFWAVATSGGMASAATDFLLRAEGTGFGTVTDVAHLRLTRVNSVVGTAGTNAGSLTNPQVNRTGLSLADLTNSFYFGSVDLGSPLPVTLLEFAGRASNATAELNWSTASERNFDRFVIERMVPGGGFEGIGEVAAKGTSVGLTRYAFQDLAAPQGSLYYRLRIVDLDNSFEYSKVIHVVNEGGAAWVAVYPNPVTDRFFHFDVFDGSTESRHVVVYDQLGRTLIHKEFFSSSNELEIPVSAAPGICFVKITSGDKQEIIKLLVK